jgi:acetylornithine deacetylase/succinyl-diaminopimelate desuccinylase-like protein
MRRPAALFLLFGVVLAALAAAAQRPAITPPPSIDLLLKSPAIQAAFDAARQGEPLVVEDQAAITEIPAPPFKESVRAADVKRRFEALGLRHVRVDAAGNVIGERPGRTTRPSVVLAAHLDTVFPEGTDVRVRREGSVLRAPGIADDGRGLAVLLGVARALDKAGVVTDGPIYFVADVGEEGLGDLRGVKQLFRETLAGKVDSFVSVDGTGHGITNVAVGSHRYRVTFRGPGGHSFGAFGLVNPIHALGRAVGAIAEVKVPTQPKVTFNVGRIGGGTSVNSIAGDAWFEVDMRSADGAALAAVDASIRSAIDRAVQDENARWGNGRLDLSVDLVGDRPAGRTPEQAPIVRTAVAVNRALGLPATLGESSTDANIPISLGIPAITVGGGGSGRGAHTLAESFDAADSWKGTQRVLLLVVALASM